MSTGTTFCVSSLNEIVSWYYREPFNDEMQNVALRLYPVYQPKNRSI